MKISINLMAFLCLTLLLREIGQANEDECYYELDAINYEYFITHTKFSNAEWDNNKKEARVDLDTEGENVLVSYSACYQLGLTATYNLKKNTDKSNASFLIRKIKWLGEMVLSKSDYCLLISALDNKEFINDLNNLEKKQRVSIEVEGSNYQSFLVYAVSYKNDFYVEISWAM